MELRLLIRESLLSRFPIVDLLELRVLPVMNRLALLFITDEPVLGYEAYLVQKGLGEETANVDV